MISTRAQMEKIGYRDVRFEDVLVDPATSSVHIIISMVDEKSGRHRFRLIATPVSDTPITWLNSLSLDEKGPAARRFLAELKRRMKMKTI